MLIYIAVALFPLLVGTYYNARIGRYLTEETISKKYLRKRWAWLLVAALPMFALIAFRNASIGNDTGGYLSCFDQMVDTPWEKIFIVNDANQQFEVGFVVFEKIITTFTHDANIYQIIYSSIYLVSVVTFANQLERSNFAFLFFFTTLGIYTFMFTGVRQCLAMCICLFSYKFVRERKLMPFLLLLLLAFLFHKSALLFLAAYVVYNRKINWINALVYVVVGVLSYVYIEIIQEFFNGFLEYDYEVEETGNGGIFFLVVVCITVFSYLVILRSRSVNLTDQAQGMLNVGVITLIFWLVRLVNRVAERPSYYFMFFTIAMLCHGIEATKNEKERIIYKVAICSLSLILFAYRFTTNLVFMIPYHTFFG